MSQHSDKIAEPVAGVRKIAPLKKIQKKIVESVAGVPKIAPLQTIQQKSDAVISVVNKGTGAGGANTTKNGKAFEEKTSNEPRLLSFGFVKHNIPSKKGKKAKYDYYLEKSTKDGSIVYLTQGGMASYFMWKFNIEMVRYPDEAYLIQRGDTYILRVLEKKNQNVKGSVDTKLLAGPGMLEEYQLCIEGLLSSEDDATSSKIPRKANFTVQYAFCLSAFLQEMYMSNDTKWKHMRTINERHGITVFFGDEEDYYELLDTWIFSAV